MNAAVRAVVLAARKYNIEVVGIQGGYYGAYYHPDTALRTLSAADVENIIDEGGTILDSARFEDFKTDFEGISKAIANNLRAAGIEAVVVPALA